MGNDFRDWAGLPGDLLHMVLNKLGSYREYQSFSLVCNPWLSVVREREEKEVLSLRPLLLLTTPYLDPDIHLWLLRNVTCNRKYNLWLTPRDFKSFCGSSHGWLAGVNEDNNLVLMNPCSHRTIPLPPLQFVFGSTIAKVVLSGDPDSAPLDDCLVAAIYGEHNTLAFTKLGRECWTYVDQSLEFFKDVMFDGDRLLAVDWHGQLISLDPHFALPRIDAAKVDMIVPRCMKMIHYAYIVRSCRNGAVMMIRRLLSYFRIFKLVEADKRFRWEEIQSLEDESFFVGLNHSVSVSCLGIFSALPNRVFVVGPMANRTLECAMHHHTEERQQEPLGSLSKLEKLFCLDDNF